MGTIGNLHERPAGTLNFDRRTGLFGFRQNRRSPQVVSGGENELSGTKSCTIMLTMFDLLA